MKVKIIFLCLFFYAIVYPQYFGERTTEQNFEQSDLYFKSHFLNTFGLNNFKNIAPGFFDDPFLNLYINPAAVPDLGDNELLIYVDFRGDRKTVPLIDNYVIPLYYTDAIYRPYYDLRLISTARSEPEPIFSIGILDFPLKNITKSFLIGGTYQLINRQEKFYAIPYGIYYPNYYYDALGIRAEGLRNVPVKDQYSGKDELSTVGHLFSVFTGYKITDNFSVGFSLNSVIHSRDGEHSNTYQDEFGGTNNNDWSNSNSEARDQDYDHLDLSGGILYNLTNKITVGVKIGYLKGEADQNYTSTSKYSNQFNTPNISNEWNYNVSDYQNNQEWNHDGNSKYFSVNFTRYIDDSKEFSGYYRYTNSDIDLTNSTNILDTSYYTSRYYSVYDTAYYSYGGRSFASDVRSGTGSRKSYMHEALLNLLWKLTNNSNVRIGIYYNSTNSKVTSSELVTALRKSNYSSAYKYNSYNFNYELFEDKLLEWNYESQNWSMQIPIVFNFSINDKWGLMLGLNRILSGWEINNKTTAYFEKREKDDNGQITIENNFGERYTQPTQKITEDFTKIIAGLNVKLSEAFKVNLLVDPEFDDEFRFAQWWLSFTAKL